MKKKRLVMMVFFAMIIMHCEDNNNNAANVGSNCGLETTFIKDIDNIDELGNASGLSLIHI